MIKLAPIRRPAASVLSGLGMVALFPPFHAGDLVWFVLIPLLAALWTLGEKGRKRKALLLGYLCGLAFFFPSLTWLREVSDVGWIAVSVYLAVYPALWALFVATRGNPWLRPPAESASRWAVSLHSLRYAFACATVWAGLELARGWVITGFSWNTLGVAFHETPVIAQAADIFGATGLSILPLFLQAVLLQAGWRIAKSAKTGRLRAHFDFGITALLIAGVASYGIYRISTVGRGEAVRLKALLVQLNIPQEAMRQTWTATEVHQGYEEETLSALEKITEDDQKRLGEAMNVGDQGQIQLKTPDWIVWPETALTGLILRMDDGRWAMGMENRITMDRVREAGDFTLVMGVNETEGVESEFDPDSFMLKPEGKNWNSLAVITPDEELETFRKHHLVIFGEYIPLVDQLPFLARIYEQQSGVKYGGAFDVGEELEPLLVKIQGQKVGVIPAVCFEDTVARLIRKFVRQGPQIIVNVTNDGWFKNSQAAAQHFANARFRAIELRRPMIRCANTGVSAAITPTGLTAHPDGGPAQELRDSAGNHLTRGSLLTEVNIPMNPPTSLYSIIGDWGVGMLALMGFGIVRRRK